jgi:hypothetical protein
MYSKQRCRKKMQLNGRLACSPVKATIEAKSSTKSWNLQLLVNILVLILVLLTRQHSSSGKIWKEVFTRKITAYISSIVKNQNKIAIPVCLVWKRRCDVSLAGQQSCSRQAWPRSPERSPVAAAERPHGQHKEEGAPCRRVASAPHSLSRVNQCAPSAGSRQQPSVAHPGGW